MAADNSTQVRWHRNEVDWDRLYGIYALEPSFETVPIDQVDMARSLNNQNRGSGVHVDRAVVEDLALAMAAGRLVDAPILRRLGPDLTYLLDGNHRVTAALDLGETEVQAWVVSCSDVQAHLIATLANVGRHGQGLSREHRMRVCMGLIGKGYSIDDVARAAGVKPATVREYMRASGLLRCRRLRANAQRRAWKWGTSIEDELQRHAVDGRRADMG